MSAAGENAIQELAIGQLRKNSYFAEPMPMLGVDAGDLQDIILKAVNPLKGCAMTFMAPVGEQVDPKTGAVILHQLLEVSAIEQPRINRAAGGMGKPAYQAIRKVMAPFRPDGTGGLHHWEPGVPFTRLELIDYDVLPVKVKETTLVIYQAVFQFKEAII